MWITTKITYAFLFLILLSPLLSYITFGLLGLRPIYFYLQIFVTFYGIFFIITLPKKIQIPKFAFLALLWVIYVFIWTVAIGRFGKMGILGTFLSNSHLSIFFLLIIIYNTRFSQAFIDIAILILKITVILAALASIKQVFDSNFMNANSFWLQPFQQEYIPGMYDIRRSSIFGFIDRNEVGLSFLPILAVLTGFLISKKSNLQFIFLLLGGITALLSNTRYVIIGFIILTTQILLASKAKLKGIVNYLLVGSLLFFASFQILPYLGYNMQEWFDTRVFREETIQKSERYISIDIFLRFFPKNPVFGNGNITDQKVIDASILAGTPNIHVGYLIYLVAYGVIGCFFLFGFWFLLAKNLFDNARKTKYWGSFLAFLIFLWSFATMYQVSIFYYGLIFALVFDKYFSDKRKFKLFQIKRSYSLNNAKINILVPSPTTLQFPER